MTRSVSAHAFAAALLALLLALAMAVGGSAGTADAASAVRFSKSNFDSPGPDNGKNSSLNGEWVTIKNFGTKAVSLKGWKVKDKQGHTYTFGTFSLGAGKSVTLYTGKGTDTAKKRYWGQSWYIWNNSGETAYLKAAAGYTADSCDTNSC